VSGRRSSAVSILVVIAAFVALAGSSRGATTLTYKSYPTYLGDVRPVLGQWQPALDNFRGHHILLAPDASNTADATHLQGLLNQWYGPLEAEHQSHFLLPPTLEAIDTTPELHSLLNQWQNALENWGGFHYLLEPPGPLTFGTPTKTGSFKLKPRTPDVGTGERSDYEIAWTVPQPNNWHDLKTIDLRVCRHDTLLIVRWQELTNTLSLLNPKNGHELDSGVVGSRGRLQSPAAKLFLGSSSVEAKGPAARKVRLGLDLAFQRSAAGVQCDLSLAAADDLGIRDPFKLAGKISIG
jgi:hypothetical protein